jgi:FkbM family methyltransferase
MQLQESIHRIVRLTGYDLVKKQYAVSLTRELRERVADGPDVVFFDVGANVGQTVTTIRRDYPRAKIHAFEPSPSTFARLRDNVGGHGDLTLVQAALGATVGRMDLHENAQSDMSSFLPTDRDGWGEVLAKTSVAVDTVDNYCAVHDIEAIDVLKIDAQGFDLEVLRGAENMLREGRVGVIWMELIFADQYVGQADFGETYSHLRARGHRLVNLYAPSFRDGRLAWADGLFVRDDD